MAIQQVRLPRWGTTMQEAHIAKILVVAGDSVSKGQMLLSIETDKVATEMESPFQGVVRDILVSEGDVVPVNTVLLTVDVL